MISAPIAVEGLINALRSSGTITEGISSNADPTPATQAEPWRTLSNPPVPRPIRRVVDESTVFAACPTG